MSDNIFKKIACKFSKASKLEKEANLCEDRGDHARAFELRKECYEYCVNRVGEDDPNTLMSMMNLAVIHARRLETEEARKLVQRCYGLRVRVLGDNHPDTVRACKYCDMLGK